MSTGVIDSIMSKLADHCIIEQGTMNSWKYRKWSDGTAECWRTITSGSSAFSATGNVYYRSFTSQNLPTNLFSASPYLYATVEFGNIGGTSINNVTKSSFDIHVLSAVSTARSLIIYVYAYGAWN